MSLETTELPRYRVLAPVYLDDQLWPVDAELTLAPDAWPNPQMEPLNEAARQRMAEYLPHTVKGDLASQIGEAWANRHKGPMVMPARDTTVPLMGNLALPGQKKRGRPAKVVASTVPAPNAEPKGPKRVMGTIGMRDTTDGI